MKEKLTTIQQKNITHSLPSYADITKSPQISNKYNNKTILIKDKSGKCSDIDKTLKKILESKKNTTKIIYNKNLSNRGILLTLPTKEDISKISHTLENTPLQVFTKTKSPQKIISSLPIDTTETDIINNITNINLSHLDILDLSEKIKFIKGKTIDNVDRKHAILEVESSIH